MNIDSNRKNLIREDLIGMNYELANQIYNIRLVEEDGSGLLIVSNIDSNRINVSVENGIITKVEFY